MQFSLRTFLALPLAWLLALCLAQVMPAVGSRRYYRYMSAASAISEIRFWAANQTKVNGKLAFSGYDTTELLASLESTKDPWGNPYRFAERDETGIHQIDSTFHAYSTGEDGVSHSSGSDSDDINSWDPQSHARNISRLNQQSRTIRYSHTIWLTPLVYGGWILCRRYRG